MRALLVPATLAAVLCAGTAAAADSTPSANLGCGSGKLVLNVKYHVLNDVDTGVQGNNWAFDAYVRTLRVVSKGHGSYCAGSTYSGSFTSINGASPGGRTTIPAGIRGTMRGSSVTTFRGAFAPAAQRTRGDLGTKDFACTSAAVKGECSGTWDWLSAYFTSTDGFKSFKYVRYAFVYHATEGGHGTWTDMLTGGQNRTHGDIVAKKKP